MAKKIMFNDRYRLTDAVLKRNKTMTRRLIKDEKLNNAISQFGIDRISLVYAHSVIDGDVVFAIMLDSKKTIDCISPKYKVGEVVAVVQSYNDLVEAYPAYATKLVGEDITGEQIGCRNKMYVRSNLMRHHIKITDIRAERLQDISNEDCLKEGIEIGKCGNETSGFMTAYYIPNDVQPFCKPTEAFSELIDKVSGRGSWKRNNFVWVYEFKLID